MLKHTALYEGVLRSLDKFTTPSFEVDDFNQFMNEAIGDDVDVLLASARTGNRQAVLELQRIEKVAESPVDALQTAGKPLDFWHPRSLLVIFKPAAGATCQPFGMQPEISAEILLPEQEEAYSKAMGNHYVKPAVTRPFYRAGGARIEILAGSTRLYAADKIRLRYVYRPAAVKLEQDLASASGILETSDGVTPFSQEMDERLIARCANSLMLRGEDVRLENSVKLKLN